MALYKAFNFMLFFKKKTNGAIGLIIKPNYIELMQLEKKDDGFQLIAYSKKPFSKQALKDGFIVDKQEISQTIKKAYSNPKFGKFTTKNCLINISERHVFTYLFKIPKKIKEKTVDQLVNLLAEDVLPLEFKDYYTDYFYYDLQDREYNEILYIASQGQIIDDYYNVAYNSGLNPVIIELECYSLARTLIKQINPDEAILLVKLGAVESVFAIFTDNGLKNRTVLSGKENYLIQELARNFQNQDKDSLENKKNTKTAENLAENLNKFIKKYERNSEKIISKVILTGPFSLLKNLNKELSSKINKKVIGGKDIEFSFADKLGDKQAVYYAQIIGLAKKGCLLNVSKLNEFYKEGEINLLPEEIKKERNNNSIEDEANNLNKNNNNNYNNHNKENDVNNDKEVIVLDDNEKENRTLSNFLLENPFLNKLIKSLVFTIFSLIVIFFAIYPWIKQKIKIKLPKQNVKEETQLKSKINDKIKAPQKEILSQNKNIKEDKLSKTENNKLEKKSNNKVTKQKIKTPAKLTKKISYKKRTYLGNKVITINPNDYGYLNIRNSNGLSGKVIGKAKPGEKYAWIKKQYDWYQIKFGNNKIGWVSGVYVTEK